MRKAKEQIEETVRFGMGGYPVATLADAPVEEDAKPDSEQEN